MNGREVSDALASMHPVTRDLVDRFGPYPVGRRPPVADRFVHLARDITYQQLAGAAANTIWRRVEATMGGEVSPERLLATPTESLRAAGLSGNKEKAMRSLASAVANGDLPLSRVGRMADDHVIAALTTVWGIGTWTAHMFLISALGRLDVWPTGDLGVRVGFGRAFGLGATPSEKELGPLGDPFRPYRSAVAWYCWQVVDVKDA